MTRTLPLALALLIVALAAIPSGASASVSVGLGDGSFSAFGDPHFTTLGLKKARIIVPWNVAQKAGDSLYLNDYLTAAAANGIQPFITFGVAAGSKCPAKPCKLPTVAQFRSAMRAFRGNWPALRTLGVWNEANQRAQPTFRHPDRAAQYYLVLKSLCRGCTIVAADVLDDPNMTRWLRDFRKVAPKARLWGLHNYRDTNPRRGQHYGGTKAMLDAVPGKIWLTETGGIVKFVLPNGHTLFPYSEKRANVAIGRLFNLAKKFRSRIQRLYVYHWRQDAFANRFDAGLLNSKGVPRPSYHTVERWLNTPWFAP